MSTSLPYPGLRPFHRDESDIFFGREEQTDELLDRLDQSRFLAVVGPSGCGKSSLVIAGMIASLESGFVASAGAYWRAAAMRPGRHPMERLAAALLTALGRDKDGQADAASFLHATLRRGPLGLVEALRETPLPGQTNLLLLVDQFEEIFRYRSQGDSDEADAFVALLLATAAQREMPVYVVITMRSDYMGDCALFGGLPEALNESQFLTPRLSREQRRDAIVGPARVFGGDVEPALLNRLLNDMGADPDQLPLMQHVLMRMWTQRHAAVSAGEAEEAAPPPTLTLADYEAAGGLAEALSKHADEAYEQLDEGQQRIAEALFRCLSERGSNERDTRRPVPLEEVAAVAGVPFEHVEKVVEVFRHPDCSFIRPPAGEPVHPYTVLDISHESLIRQWKRMNEWVEQEARSAETYRFLEQTARLWKAGRAALWGTPNLENALVWKEREKPTPAWAERYGGNFELAMQFLDASQEERKAREAERRRAEQQTRKNKWLQRVSMLLVVALLGLGAGILGYLDAYHWEHHSYYNTFTRRFGIPEGIGPLTPQQVRRRAVSWRFVRRGRSGPLLRMEAVDSRGKLTPKHSVGTHLNPQPDHVSPTRECKWEFVRDSQLRIIYEQAHDKHGKPVWGLVYSPPVEGDPRRRRARYVGPQGGPLKREAANFVDIRYSREGYEVRLSYFDGKGNPRPGPDKAFGRQQEFDKRGLMVKMTSLDAAGQAMNDEAGNATLTMTYDELGNITEAVASDASGARTTLKSGYAEARPKHDDAGRSTEWAFFDVAGQPALHKDGYHKHTTKYDDRGNAIELTYRDASGTPTLIVGGFARWVAEYDDRGDLVAWAYFDADGQPTNHTDGHRACRSRYDELGNLLERIFLGADEKPTLIKHGYAGWRSTYTHGKEVERVYLDIDLEPRLRKDGYARWTRKYDGVGNQVRTAYFGVDGKPARHIDGHCAYESLYDEHGNLVERVFLGADGEPTLFEGEHAGWRSTYIYGKEVERVYLAIDRKPCLREDGYAGWKKKYDHGGNEVRTAYFGVDRKPARHIDGHCAYESRYDELGNLVEQIFLGADEKPTLINDGYAGWRSTYKHGNEVKRVYLGIDLEPCLLKDGYAGWRSSYNKHRKEVKRVYFGIDLGPRLRKDGYASWKKTYDDRDYEVRTAYFGVDDKPARHTDGDYAYEARYDELGNLVERIFLGADEKPTLINDDYAGWRSEYNRHGKEVERVYLGIDRKPRLRKDGYASWKAKYDRYDNQVEVCYYRADGKPATWEGGYYRRERRFNYRGQVLEESTYDIDGDLVVNTDGYARLTQEYDARGNLIELAAFGADGKRSHVERYGGARITLKYDEDGNEIERAHFGVDGKLAAPDGTYARWVTKYDEGGNPVEQRWFGTDGKPFRLAAGYARVVRKYDQRGKVIEQRFFGPDTKPARVYAGPHIIRCQYDDRGNTKEVAYFGIDEEPIMVSLTDGPKCARWVVERDRAGKLIRKRYYDEKEQPIEPPAVAASPKSVRIGTGDVTGLYYPTGRAISRMYNRKAKQYEIKATAEATPGSVSNINAVLRGDLKFGLAQSDRQYQAYHGEAEWLTSGAQKELRAVFSIYPEAVTLIASAESGIRSVSDLRGKRVNIGNPGSGQLQNSRDVLAAFGIDLDSIKAVRAEPLKALGLLQSGKIDALFYTVGHPCDNIKKATSGRVKVNIIPIKGKGIDALVKKHPYYAHVTIPGGSYPSTVNKGDVASVGVRATLVTSQNVDDDIVYRITKAVFENLEDFKKLHPAYSVLTKKGMLEGLSAPIHRGARRYYVEEGLWKHAVPKVRE